MPMGILLNIGCGGDIRSGYVNIDAFAEGDLKMDAGCLGFPSNSVDGVYSSHVLEHLSKHEIGDVLAEWNRVLKVTGTVEVIVPDFPWCLKQWLRLSERSRWDWPWTRYSVFRITPVNSTRPGLVQSASVSC